MNGRSESVLLPSGRGPAAGQGPMARAGETCGTACSSYRIRRLVAWRIHGWRPGCLTRIRGAVAVCMPRCPVGAGVLAPGAGIE
jgi:hypothetical protein